MKLVLAGFVLILLCIPAFGQYSHEGISLIADMEMFEEHDLRTVQNINPQVIEKLPLEERNEVALVLARSLSIKKYIGVIGKYGIRKYLTPSGNNLPKAAEIRKQWDTNFEAASLLRHMAEKRMIDDPKILPYLIDALDHPEKGYVGRRCFYALMALTRREHGSIGLD